MEDGCKREEVEVEVEEKLEEGGLLLILEGEMVVVCLAGLAVGEEGERERKGARVVVVVVERGCCCCCCFVQEKVQNGELRPLIRTAGGRRDTAAADMIEYAEY